jgi:hypothetical protein
MESPSTPPPPLPAFFQPGTSVLALVVFNLSMLLLISAVFVCYYYLGIFNIYILLLSCFGLLLGVSVNILLTYTGLEGNWGPEENAKSTTKDSTKDLTKDLTKELKKEK